MADQRPQRQLSAILAADVAGYSRLIGLDEEGTLARLKALRRNLIDPKIEEHRGRIVKTMGDGLLVQFGSVVDAVRCAADIQRLVTEQQTGTADDRRILFRMGVNIGDIVIDGDDIHGDGVNVAARLEGLSEPGGMCVSSAVHDHVRDKLDIAFEDIGEQQLKNVTRPVRVYRLMIGLPRPSPNVRDHSSKPSVAILPFSDMSGGGDYQYFSDGITEDIITELSRYKSLFVIARNSSFQYRGANIDVRRIGRELGVNYVVEGSVRRAGDRLRITAQLIDASSGDHVWAERYDRDMQDVFAVQDELARTVASTLEGRVAASAADKSRNKPTRDWKAYDYFLQGREWDHKYDLEKAEACFERAVELDPYYAHAHAFRAIALAVMHWGDLDQSVLGRAETFAQKALSVEPHDGWSQLAAGYIAVCQKKFDLAGIHFKRALSLNPNDILIATDYANWLTRTGRPQEGLEYLDAAMKRDPYPPEWFWEARFRALFHLGRYDEAIVAISSVVSHHDWPQAYLAAAYAQGGQPDAAHAALANFIRLKPAATLSWVARAEPYSDQRLLDELLDGLHKAGLPE